MDFTGHHLIDGAWIGGGATFDSQPASGPARAFQNGTAAQVDQACRAAEAAFPAFAATTRATRAALLNAIADQIEARGAQITEIGCQESGLPEARLNGERGRTTGQLRMFAQHILEGRYLDCRHDPALPDRAPAPRPELYMVQRPIGPVAVFGASNFPLAFSTAGGDTASALAAGCPVVVKGHPAHPGTTELVAQAIDAALVATGLPRGVFNMVQGNTTQIGSALVQHPLIRAVGFTGSLGGGRALFDLCAARPEPIPFFGELGSVNPVFVLPHAAAARATAIAEGWAGSLTMGAGQFCTNPGVLLITDGPEAEAFIGAAQAALSGVAAQTMLTDGIAQAFQAGCDRFAAAQDVTAIATATAPSRQALPNLFVTTGEVFLNTPALAHEVFGPVGMVVRVRDAAQMQAIAAGLEGQLTCTLQMDVGDTAQAQILLPVLERKAGRILANGFPTGVEVAEAMVHGGPYPASTNFGHTSVGTLAIRRFLRPVCYQNLPAALLPQECQASD